MLPQLPVHTSTKCTRNDTLNSEPFLIFDSTCHKLQSKTNSAVIAAADNHFLPPSENDYDNDADTANLMGKYDSGGKKKGKGGHCRRYRDDNKIDDLHGPYEEPKDDGDGCDNADDGD